MQKRFLLVFALGTGCVLLSGCPKGGGDASLGDKAELNQNYDAALDYFNKAAAQDPKNTEWKLKLQRVRFEAGQYHYQQGMKLRDQGNLQQAAAEFQKALSIDPSSPIAAEELKKTADMLKAQMAGAATATPETAPSEQLAVGPPKLAPLSRTPIDIPKMNANDRLAFQTIAKLAGVTVIFDPTLQPKPMTVELPNVTLEEALDIVALQSKTFWTPVAPNVILVSDDNQNNRRSYEDEVFKTFYLNNTVTDQDLNDVVQALRNTLGATTQAHITPIKSLNAIVMRDTPDKIMLAGRVIEAIDKAKPEVVVDVKVLEARRDLVRNLGINPGTSASLTFCPPNASTTVTGSTTTTPQACTSNTTGLALNQLAHLSSADFVAQLPGATVTALLTDNTTKVLENPQVRSVDGEHAILKIGTRVPIATGSFQAGTGVGVSTAGTSLVNPLVNTQFQYQDVGVNVDLTPKIHGDRDVSLKIKVEISSVSGTQNIGGINQPVISQKSIDHDIRLKDGEVSVMGGLIERQDTNNIAGWPGLARIPLLHYLFAETDVEHEDDEVLIVLTPHVVRIPMITSADLQTIETGTDANVQLRTASAVAPAPGNPTAAASSAPPAAPQPMVAGGQPALHFEPNTITLKPGDTATVGVVVQNVTDLFSIPILLQYNPAVISVEEVRHGGFLSGSTGEEALVQRIDQQHGQAVISASRTANTPGVSGTGTLVGIVIKGLAPGDSKLSIVQVNARDSQQKPISFVTSEGSVHVQQ
jgi:general secretion pathway protein D